MKRILLRTMAVAMMAAMFAGCATKSESTAEKKEGETIAEAPLGSRIRKRTSTPAVGNSELREQMEQGRVQAAAQQSGAVQRGK